MKNIVIIDYGLGNIFSIKQSLATLGVNPIVTNDAKSVLDADAIILPGVGAFPDAMSRLNELGLVMVLRDCAQAGKPILGICLGMQLLFNKSFEYGEHEGLSLLDGDIVKFPTHYGDVKLKVPFVGWNNLSYQENRKDNVNSIYLVHSFYAKPTHPEITVATCSYNGMVYPAIVQKHNIIGIQGHPEKSATHGINFFKQWISRI